VFRLLQNEGIMMYPIHSNSSGFFQELAHKKDVKFGQLSYLVIEKNCTRGNHYHKRKQEWFCCIHGKCEMQLCNVRNNKMRTVILDSLKKEFVKVYPFENHILKNLSKNEKCELLIIISEEYDENDPDTFSPEE